MPTSGKSDRIIEYVTVVIAGQLFGLPIARVQDVFVPGNLTLVPLAPDDVAGVLNLRGRIVTAINMRRRLGFVASDKAKTALAVGIEVMGESYGLMVDAVGEVLKLREGEHDAVPSNLDETLASVASGVHRLENALLVLLDVDRLLDIKPVQRAA